MGERQREGVDREKPVRDFGTGGDVGEGSHGAFAHPEEERVHRNDERLGERGRNPARDESGLIDEVERDRAQSLQHEGPGEVRGLDAPDRDDVGA